MGRTPLFRDLTRAYGLARESLRTGESADEVVQRARAEAAMSRRRFLGWSAAGVAALALDGCAYRGGRIPDAPVIVVGAGIAGLTAAYRLRQYGVPVRVFEAQDRVGGRMFSLRNHFADGQVAELGGELIDSGHHTILGLARELEIAVDDLACYAPGAEEVHYFGGQRRTEVEIVRAFTPVARTIATIQDAIGDDVTYRSPRGLQALDRTTLAEWLERNVEERWFRDLLEVGYVTEFGLEADRQSALNLMVLIGTDPYPFHIYGESDERYHVHEGNDLIPRTLAERISGTIETGTVLEAVSRRSDGLYVCTFRRGEGMFEASSRHVVLALPFTLLRHVRMDVPLRPVKRRAIQEIGYGTNAKLMIGFSARPWVEHHGSDGSTLADLPYQVTWETSRMQAGGAGILTNFTGGARGMALGEGTPAARAAEVTAQLERVYPGISAYRAGMTEARFHWPTNPWVRGSYACYLPGQWTGFAGAEGEAEGGIHFAGEHCSRQAQGFMEGGAETGHAVAQVLLRQFGVVDRLPGPQAVDAAACELEPVAA